MVNGFQFRAIWDEPSTRFDASVCAQMRLEIVSIHGIANTALAQAKVAWRSLGNLRSHIEESQAKENPTDVRRHDFLKCLLS